MNSIIKFLYFFTISGLLLILIGSFLTFLDWLDEREEEKLIGPLRKMLSQPQVITYCMTFDEIWEAVAEGDPLDAEYWRQV